MHKISLLLNLILFTSCSMNRMKPNVQLKEQMEVDIVSYRIQNSDSFNVNIILRIPLKALVFKKQRNQFVASINYTFNTSNRDTKAVGNRVTKNKSIYYKNSNRFHIPV